MESIAKHGQQINNSNALADSHRNGQRALEATAAAFKYCVQRLAHAQPLVNFYVHYPPRTQYICLITKLIKILWLFVELVGWLFGVCLLSFISIASVLQCTVYTWSAAAAPCFQLQFQLAVICTLHLTLAYNKQCCCNHGLFVCFSITVPATLRVLFFFFFFHCCICECVNAWVCMQFVVCVFLSSSSSLLVIFFPFREISILPIVYAVQCVRDTLLPTQTFGMYITHYFPSKLYWLFFFYFSSLNKLICCCCWWWWRRRWWWQRKKCYLQLNWQTTANERSNLCIPMSDYQIAVTSSFRSSLELSVL